MTELAIRQIVVKGSQFHSAVLVSQLTVSELGVPVRWVPENPPFTSWDCLDLDGYRLDNGHHSIEVPRAYELVNFIRTHDLSELLITQGHDYLCIEGHVLPSNLVRSQWPTELKRDVSGSDLLTIESISELDERVSGELRSTLLQISRRYSDNWNAARNVILPWFLPGNFGLRSIDEGDAQRNLISAGLATKSRIRPRPPLLFSDLGINWIRFLEAQPSLKIDRETDQFWSTRSPQLKLERVAGAGSESVSIANNVDLGKPVFAVTVGELESWGTVEWSGELLVASSNMPQVARVWQLPSQERKLIVIESFHADGWNTDNFRSLNDQIHVGLLPTLGISPRQFHVRNVVASRNYGGARAQVMAPGRTGFELHHDADQLVVTGRSLGPVNMAKGWRLAANALNRIEERL